MSREGTYQDQQYPPSQPFMPGAQSMPGFPNMPGPQGQQGPWQSMPATSPGAPPSVAVGPFGPGAYGACGQPGFSGSSGPTGPPGWSGWPGPSGPSSAPPGTLPISDPRASSGRSASKSGKRRCDCGAKLTPDAVFCRKCGKKFGEPGQEPVMPPREFASTPDVPSQPQHAMPPFAPAATRALKPAEDALLPKPGNADQPDPKKIRRTVAMIHFGILLAIFMPPFMLCINLATNNDFRYFIGSSPLYAVFVLVFIMLVPIIDLNFKVSTWWFMASVWIPVAVFITVGGFTRNDSYRVMAALDNPDCYSFAEKRDLQRAYSSAQDLYHQCASQPDFLSIEECAGYEDLMDEWQPQIHYLKAIEDQFPCGGICHESERLWSSTGTQAPACSLFIAQWIYGSYIQCVIMTYYSIFVGVAAFIVFELLNPFLREYWEPMMQPPMRGKADLA